MSDQTIKLILIGCIIGLVLIAPYIFRYLKKTGVDVPKLLEDSEQALNVVEPAIQLAKNIEPSNKVINVIDIIEKYAKIAVLNSEQLFKNTEITNNEDKKKNAINMVNLILKELKIDITPEQTVLMSKFIESEVYSLPHMPADVKQLQVAINEHIAQNNQLQSENTNLKATINQQNTQNTQLQTENTQLKNTLSQIQNTVGTNLITTNANDTTIQQ